MQTKEDFLCTPFLLPQIENNPGYAEFNQNFVRQGVGFKCKKALQQQYQDWKSKMIGKRNKRNRTGEGKQQEMHQYEKMLEEFLYGRFANTTVSVSIFVFVIL